MKNHHSQKAYKKCIICGNNFVTTEIDSAVFCKDCQKHRDTAETLQNLLKHINPNEKFSIGDLIPYYKFSTLNNVINALIDDGLLDFNPNDNTYSLKDKRVLDDFLNKYLIDPETAPQPINNEYPYNYTKERHDTVIKAIQDGKTRKEAAKLAGINFRYLERWYIEGQKGIEPFKQYYKDYELNKKDPKKKSEEDIKKETEEFNLNKLKINKFIDSIKYGFTVKKSAEISGLDYKQVQKWLYYGNREKEPFNEFSKEYKDAKKEATKNRNIFKKSEVQRDAFIVHIKTGFSLIDSCQKANLEVEEVLEWIKKGEYNIKPYVKFYETYQKVKAPKKNKTSLEKDREQYTKEKHETIINAIKDKKTITEAVKLAGISIIEENRWYTYGQKGIEPFKQYYEDYNFWKKEGQKKEEIKKETSEFLRNYKKINIFIKAIMGEKNFKDAIQISELNEKKLQKWLDYGKQGIEPFKITFDEYEEAKNKKPVEKTYSHKYNKKRHEIVINAIKEGKTRREAAELAGITLKDLGYWYNTGMNRREPFKQFYEDYESNKIDPQKKKEEKIEKETTEFEQNSSKIKTFLIETKNGTSRNKSAKLVELDYKQIMRWLNYGKKGIEPFKQFYEDYYKCKPDPKKLKEERIKKETTEFEQNSSKIKTFLIETKNGKNRKEATEQAELDKQQVENWLNYGKEGIEPFKQFLKEYEKAKKEKKKDVNKIKSLIENSKYDERRHEKVIEAIKEGKSREIAAELAGIELRDIEKWYNYGKKGIEPFKQYYKDYISNKPDPKKLKEERIKKETTEFEQNSSKIKTFLIETKNGKNRKEATEQAKLDKQQVENWLRYGKEGIEPFKQFNNTYISNKPDPKKLKEEKIKKETNEFKQKIHKVRRLIEKIENGNTIKEAINLCELKQSQITLWLNYGKEEIVPFKQFFDEYNQAKEERAKKEKEKENEAIKKGKEIFKQKSYEIQRFLTAIELGNRREKALELSGLNEEEVARWLRYGRRGIDPYNQFLNEYSNSRRINKIEEKNKLNEKREFEKSLRTFIVKTYDENLEPEILFNSELVKELKTWEKKSETVNYGRFLKKYKELEKRVEKNLAEYKENEEGIKSFLNEFRNHRNEEEALKNSKLDKKLVIKWQNKGEKNIKPYKKFYESINYIKINREYDLEEYEANLNKQEILLKEILDETPEEEALKTSGLEKDIMDKWIELGNAGIEPFRQFLIEYNKAKRRANSNINKFKRTKVKRAIFIEYIEEKYSMSQACIEAKLEVEDVEDWLIKGKNGQKPYVEFHKEYENARMVSTKKPVPKRYVKSRTKSIKNNKSKLKLNVIKETNNLLDVSIEGNIPTSSMDLVNNIMKTYNAQINTSVISRIKNNQLKIYIELTIKKEELGFIKSLIKSY